MLKVPLFPYKTEGFNIKIPSDIFKDIIDDIDIDEIVGDRILSLCERYNFILDASIDEFKGIFSENELKCLETCLENMVIPYSIPCNSQMIVDAFDKSDKFKETCEYYEINVNELYDKCRSLTAAQADALYTWVKRNSKHKASKI